ncbi:hypothetical protein GCM10025791_38190 [Halioxenophilus aromaticivorans]|uniref:Uncharacterized protein n=1 Tax=Halioxenophilus aromaticivorans TaxID=1306992 RepID=A0AAV3U778_9ALTE
MTQKIFDGATNQAIKHVNIGAFAYGGTQALALIHRRDKKFLATRGCQSFSYGNSTQPVGVGFNHRSASNTFAEGTKLPPIGHYSFQVYG